MKIDAEGSELEILFGAQENIINNTMNIDSSVNQHLRHSRGKLNNYTGNDNAQRNSCKKSIAATMSEVTQRAAIGFVLVLRFGMGQNVFCNPLRSHDCV